MTRTFRVFISSTFSDLEEERNALHTLVFPDLQRLCESKNARLIACGNSAGEVHLARIMGIGEHWGLPR